MLLHLDSIVCARVACMHLDLIHNFHWLWDTICGWSVFLFFLLLSMGLSISFFFLFLSISIYINLCMWMCACYYSHCLNKSRHVLKVLSMSCWSVENKMVNGILDWSGEIFAHNGSHCNGEKSNNNKNETKKKKKKQTLTLPKHCFSAGVLFFLSFFHYGFIVFLTAKLFHKNNADDTMPITWSFFTARVFDRETNKKHKHTFTITARTNKFSTKNM